MFFNDISLPLYICNFGIVIIKCISFIIPLFTNIIKTRGIANMSIGIPKIIIFLILILFMYSKYIIVSNNNNGNIKYDKA